MWSRRRKVDCYNETFTNSSAWMGKQKTNMKRSGFSVLELIVTLIIAAMVCAAVLEILSHIGDQHNMISHRLAQQASIQYSMDKLLSDIIASAQADSKFNVEHSSYGQLETSQLTISSGGNGEQDKPIAQIDWVAVPRYEQEDLVLFRREIKPGDTDNAMYVPLCEKLYSFQVELLDADGGIYGDPNTSPSLIEVQAQLFRSDRLDPQQLLTVNRTFCLKRFELPK